MRPGVFSKESQPVNKRGRTKYNKLLEALEGAGYSEQQFYEYIVNVAMNDGDTVILKEILTRFCPASKPSAQEINFEFPKDGTPVQKIDSVITGVANGEIPADLGKLVVDMIKTSLDVEEITELAQRLEKLEEMIASMAKS